MSKYKSLFYEWEIVCQTVISQWDSVRNQMENLTESNLLLTNECLVTTL